MNYWTIFRYLYCLCSTYGLSFVSLYQDTGSSFNSISWRGSTVFYWFPTNSCIWFTTTDTRTCCIRVHGCHNSTILFSLFCLPFSFSFTLLWVTWLYLVMGHMFSHMMGYLTCHMMRAHDQSHDHGLFLLRMSHYDSLLCVSPILSLWLTLPNLWLQWMFQTIHRTYWLILPHHPYSMMSLTTCTLLFLVHSQLYISQAFWVPKAPDLTSFVSYGTSQ